MTIAILFLVLFVIALWLVIVTLGFARPPRTRDGGYLTLEDLPTIAGDNPKRRAARREFCQRNGRRV